MRRCRPDETATSDRVVSGGAVVEAATGPRLSPAASCRRGRPSDRPPARTGCPPASTRPAPRPSTRPGTRRCPHCRAAAAGPAQDLQPGPLLSSVGVQRCRPGAGVPAAGQVGVVADSEGAVARPHQLLRRGRGPLTAMQWGAAIVIRAGGPQGQVPARGAARPGVGDGSGSRRGRSARPAPTVRAPRGRPVAARRARRTRPSHRRTRWRPGRSRGCRSAATRRPGGRGPGQPGGVRLV